MKKIITLIITLVSTLILFGCQGRSGYTYVEGKVNIVATTTMLGDLARQIGQDKVSVVNLMPVGVDPHLYQAKASDTNALRKSDFILYNGLHLEGKMVDILDGFKGKKTYVNVGEELEKANAPLLEWDGGDDKDPHVWFDVENWIVAAKALGRELALHDKTNEAFYKESTEAYILKLSELHTWIKQRVSELKEEQRVLATAHDAFAYFARAYGFEVESIQGISTDSEASTADITRLVDTVINKNIKAVFIESSVPRKTIDSVISAAKSRGHQLVIGGELYSDSLGDGADSEYIQAVKTNVNIIVDALK
ncbi:Metal ion ABC transporter, periplasmic zinc-binding protein [Alteracholeplasma palmae J233]|uniref:Metal ion ABC transporter, periplasmic zinc-binding protein n=1 Tax=Alteracholeplasma palmae (strain ATCC 49389 / J233) TaxID=1318466 RepID=U4KKB0_ALTPJ|nr:zinc ABC transporter substrate-binding protein [Alteracholeplasma palmae]CCV64139.1 Metal ion ABC transporter, periplasmic zinc-binding protein [Alteracholeplasma palmae J233]